LDGLAGSAAARLAFIEVFNSGRVRQRFVGALEIGVVTAHKIALRIADQPLTSFHMQHSILSAHLAWFFDLHGIHDERFDGSIKHIDESFSGLLENAHAHWTKYFVRKGIATPSMACKDGIADRSQLFSRGANAAIALTKHLWIS
jgi:hypothetical protein